MGVDATAIGPGDVIADKYRVDRVLGKGGMGLVLAATHLELGERRAIKVLLPEVLDSEELVARFLREAKVVARLKSRHVVQVFDVGRLDDGVPFIVMEYLEGQDLEELVTAQSVIDPGTAVSFVMQAMEALAEAHAAGIVHRDIKPANMFLTEDLDGACVKVLDFGISKLTEPGTNMRMTATDAVMGTPFYMSPEQMMSSKEVDHRTDLWSLGVVLYELLCGELPYRGGTVGEQCKLLLTALPPPLSLLADQPLPDGLENAVLGFLTREPADRYSDVAAAARAIRPFATDPDAERVMRRIERALAGGVRSSLISLADSSGRFSLPAPTSVRTGKSSTPSSPRQPVTGEGYAPTVASVTGSSTVNIVVDDDDQVLSKSTRATWQTKARGDSKNNKRLGILLASVALLAGGAMAFGLLRSGDDMPTPEPAAASPDTQAPPPVDQLVDPPDEEPSADPEPTSEVVDLDDEPATPAASSSGEVKPELPSTTPPPSAEPATAKTSVPKPAPKKPSPKPAPPPPPPTKDPFGTGRH
jgi:eukaryotic-like serine/threonine-protein kinase